jgi:hypothetical protein
MKRIEQALNTKILEARFKVDRARRQMDSSTNWIGCAFTGWALPKAEAELEILLSYASEALDAR